MSLGSLAFLELVPLLSSTDLVWSQSALPAENRLAAGHYDPSRGRWRNAPETEFDLAPSSQNLALMRSEYLAQNASEKTKSAAGGVPAGVEVSIKEWVVPTLGSHPHDPLATPDGSIWYTGQMTNRLGRLDPRTGEFKEYRLKTPESGPYAIAVLNDIVWYSETGVTPNTLVRFDPKSETFRTWPIPSGGGVVRNMMATSEGHLVLACSGVDRIALVEVK